MENGKNGGNLLRNHLWRPIDLRSKGTDDDDDDDDDDKATRPEQGRQLSVKCRVN